MNSNFINNIIKEYKSDLNVGNVLFGSDNKIASLQNKKPEINTEIEKIYFEYIDDYIRSADVYSYKNLKSIMPKLQALKNKFPEILTPPNNNVYRGTGVSLTMLESLVKKYGYSKSGIGSKWLLLNEEIDYKSSSPLTSWSFNINVAKDFAENPRSGYGIIITTNVDNTFILNPKFSNLVAKEIGHIKEFETISTKNKFNNCSLFFHKKFLLELEID